MNRTLATASALTLIWLAAGGCGGSGDTPQGAAGVPDRPPSTADQRRALAALLRGTDLPASWTAAGGSPRERCRGGGAFAGVTGRGASGSFTHGRINIQQSVWIFRDAAAARQAFRAMNATSGRTCFQRQLTARVSDEASEVVEELRLVRQRRRPGLRHSVLMGKVSRLVESPLGQTRALLPVKVDEIERRSGRGVSTIVVVAAAQRPDRSVVRSLVAIAGRRLNAVVPAPGS
jgi:hypothetical protein